eukprot:9475975-Pyramimonas_sp.AAC.1
MRNDSHDAVAVVITLPGASQPGEAKRRKIAFGELSDAVGESEAEAEAGVTWPRSPSTSPPPSPTSEADGTACDKPEDEASQRAQDLHKEMREYWGQRYDLDYDPKLHHLSLLLLKKRASAQPPDGDPAGAPQPSSDYDTAF